MKAFSRGNLWELVTTRTERALSSGHLLPIATEYRYADDVGVRFLVRVIANLARKDGTRTALDGANESLGVLARAQRPRRTANPFLPYDPELYVADASPTHVCLLNKFNVVDHHLLIVTREFEHQDLPLTLADWQALWRCMAEYEGLGFYNGGRIAGASQPHKHLQFVPLPLAPEGPGIPLEPLLLSDRSPAHDRASIDRPTQAPGVPFAHRIAWLPPAVESDPGEAAKLSSRLYQQMLESFSLAPSGIGTGTTRGAYNLLVTRRWMLFVPRREECYAGISLNSLAFAGALLVRDQKQLDTLLRHGPMAALGHVAGQPVVG